MKKILIFFSVLIVCIGCTCRDEVPHYITFSDIENSIIVPEMTTTNLNFINQNSETITAEYIGYSDEKISRFPENSCDVYYSESNLINLTSNEIELNFQIHLRKNSYGYTLLEINSEEHLFVINEAPYEFSNIELYLTNYSSNDYHFNNVLLLKDFTTGMNEVIYSPGEGIVFILFENGDYLRLIE